MLTPSRATPESASGTIAATLRASNLLLMRLKNASATSPPPKYPIPPHAHGNGTALRMLMCSMSRCSSTGQ
ncbi:MAG TPA: hypothetical protein VHV99_21455 [Paraburkholderia sp.]|nr:hypothetical protein [Paraburkholderia sp.]